MISNIIHKDNPSYNNIHYNPIIILILGISINHLPFYLHICFCYYCIKYNIYKVRYSAVLVYLNNVDLVLKIILMLLLLYKTLFKSSQ